MTCQHCIKNANRYHMKCNGCAARHVLMRFYPHGEKPTDYAKKVASRYDLDVKELWEKVRSLINQKQEK